MNIRQLNYFIGIVEEGSFLKASRKLRIAQPALSQHIVNLEGELNTPLLIRSPRGVTPTAAGDVLYMHAKKIAAQLKQAKDDVLFEANTPKGEVALVLPPMLAPHVAPKLIKSVDKEYPDIQLRIIEARSLKGHTLIESGRADLGVLASETPSNNINGIVLYREPLYLVERLKEGEQQDDSLQIGFRELSRKPLVASHKKHAVRALVEKTAAEKKLPLNIKVEAESGRLLRSYVRDGVAAAVLPWSSQHHMWLDGEVSTRKIVKPDLERLIYLAWPKGFPLNAACNVVKSMLHDSIYSLYQQGIIRGEWIEPQQNDADPE
ncbi:LysR family transcriptional regulator [Motiliproteus coralliicola]|nr:LysR substrate-binding domain-containing protein [Motiliproteus coralliicola]